LAMPSDSKKTQSSRSAMPSALYRYLAMPSDSKKPKQSLGYAKCPISLLGYAK